MTVLTAFRHTTHFLLEVSAAVGRTLREPEPQGNLYPREGLGLPTVHLEFYHPYSLLIRIQIHTLYNRIRQIFIPKRVPKRVLLLYLNFENMSEFGVIYYRDP